MNDSQKLDLAIRLVARERNLKGKIAALQDAKDKGIPCLMRALTYAYDPFIRFGVALTPTQAAYLVTNCAGRVTSATLDISSEEVWDLLDEFRSSTAASNTKMEQLKRLFARLDMVTANIVKSILEKSLINGVAVSTVNKAFPGLIKVFGVQLAAKYTDRKVKAYPVVVEPKYDGMRATTIIHANGDIEVLTRTGRDIPAAKLFHDDLRKIGKAYASQVTDFKGVILDGEVLGDSFNHTVSMFRAGATASSGMYYIFDVLPLAVVQEGAQSDPYLERVAMLSKLNIDGLDTCAIAPRYMANSKSEVWDIYTRSRAIGYEGVIVKAKDGLWEAKRSNAWLKIKAEETLDLTVIGAFEGEGEFEGTLGGLIVEFEGNEVRVGSGFDRATRDLLWDQFLEDLDKSVSGQDDFYLIGTTIEVQYQEVTPAKSLRHPVFVRRRLDKDEGVF